MKVQSIILLFICPNQDRTPMDIKFHSNMKIIKYSHCCHYIVTARPQLFSRSRPGGFPLLPLRKSLSNKMMEM